MRTDEEKQNEQSKGKTFINNYYDTQRKINWYNIDDSSYEEKMVAWLREDNTNYSLSDLRWKANDSNDETYENIYYDLKPEKILMRPVSQGNTFTVSSKGLYCIRPVEAMLGDVNETIFKEAYINLPHLSVYNTVDVNLATGAITVWYCDIDSISELKFDPGDPIIPEYAYEYLRFDAGYDSSNPEKNQGRVINFVEANEESNYKGWFIKKDVQSDIYDQTSFEQLSQAMTAEEAGVDTVYNIATSTNTFTELSEAGIQYNFEKTMKDHFQVGYSAASLNKLKTIQFYKNDNGHFAKNNAGQFIQIQDFNSNDEEWAEGNKDILEAQGYEKYDIDEACLYTTDDYWQEMYKIEMEKLGLWGSWEEDYINEDAGRVASDELAKWKEELWKNQKNETIYKKYMINETEGYYLPIKYGEKMENGVTYAIVKQNWDGTGSTHENTIKSTFSINEHFNYFQVGAWDIIHADVNQERYKDYYYLTYEANGSDDFNNDYETLLKNKYGEEWCNSHGVSNMDGYYIDVTESDDSSSGVKKWVKADTMKEIKSGLRRTS